MWGFVRNVLQVGAGDHILKIAEEVTDPSFICLLTLSFTKFANMTIYVSRHLAYGIKLLQGLLEIVW